MKDIFKVLNAKEESELTYPELMEYYRELSLYCNISDLGLEIKEKFNILIKKILKYIIQYDVIIDGYENIPNTPVIYASSFQKFDDIINSIYAYPQHVITLITPNISDSIKTLIEINGSVLIDSKSKKSRELAKIELCKALFKYKSISIYPEISLNRTPSKLHLPFKIIDIIDIATIMEKPIIPVVQEYTYNDNILEDKSHIKSVHIKFGRPIYVNVNDNLAEKISEFDEVFSTICWELIEEKGLFQHNEINHDNDLTTENAKKLSLKNYKH